MYGREERRDSEFRITTGKKSVIEGLVNLHRWTEKIPEAEATIEDLASHLGVYDEYKSWIHLND